MSVMPQAPIPPDTPPAPVAPAPTQRLPAPPLDATISLAAAEAEEELAEDEEEAYEDEPDHLRHFVLFNVLPSSLVSGVIHFIGFLVLALLTIQPEQKSDSLAINVSPPGDNVEEIEATKLDLNLDAVVADEQATAEQVLQDVVETTDTPTVAIDVDAAPIRVELSDLSDEIAPKSDLMATIGAFTGSGLSGRGAAERGKMVAAVGGSAESEAAVAEALRWFAAHQYPDGSWNFDHRSGPCQGRCPDAGTLTENRTGATALALLPFLGAGQTHLEGQYKQVVERGLYFLTSQMKRKRKGGLETGDMTQGVANDQGYSHGLAAIALCEAYAMTQDRKLMGPAQLALNQIMYAQDPVGGGWRYRERQPGDTSVVGWQLMALKSGHMAYLNVAPSTIQGAMKFLDSVQSDAGAKYGYTGPGRGEATTAVGLLCRMYLGWKPDNPALKRGVEFLASTGPRTAPPTMYYNYYATQVMRQYCGEPGTEGHEMWVKWNTKMRDWLVKEQAKSGHMKGSWYMNDHGSDRGGRLYSTSMSTMILEVYYRHMPIYGSKAATEEFPL